MFAFRIICKTRIACPLGLLAVSASLLALIYDTVSLVALGLVCVISAMSVSVLVRRDFRQRGERTGAWFAWVITFSVLTGLLCLLFPLIRSARLAVQNSKLT